MTDTGPGIERVDALEEARGVEATSASDPTEASSVPVWLANIAALGWRVLAIVALLVVLAWTAGQLWVVSATIVLSVLVSAVLAPSVLRLRAGGRSRNSSTLIVWGVAMLVALGLLVLLVIALAPNVTDLARQLEAGATAVQDDLEAQDLPTAVSAVWHDVIHLLGGLVGDAVGGIVSTAASLVTVLILSVFLVFFLLRDGDRGWLWAFQALGESKRERITAAGRDALVRLGGYLRGTTILSALMAATTFLFLWLLGVPLAGALALLVFLAGYVPVVGGIVATVVVLLASYASVGLTTTLVLLALIAVRNVLMSSFVRPSVYGRTVSIHPALVLILLPAGYELAGIIGLFAAVPVAAVVIAVGSAVVSVVQPDPPPPLPGIVPGWLDRFAQWSLRILVVLGLIAVVVGAAVLMPLVVTPIVIALVVTATLDPLVSALVRRGWGRTLSSVAAVVGATLVVILLLVLAVISLWEQTGSVGAGIEAGARSIDTSANGTLGVAVHAVVQFVQSIQTIVALGGAIAAFAAVVILGLLLSVAFLADGGSLWARIVHRAPEEHRPALDGAGSRALGVLGGYMIGTAAISGVGAASQWLIMVVLGIPLALPVAVLSFILCFIPYIGGFLSTGIAFLLAVAYGSPVDIAIMLIWTVVFNIVQGNIVSPLVYGRTVSLHPAVVLMAIPAAGAIAGVLGMFLVVPALGVVAATWRAVLGLIGGTDAAPDMPDAGVEPSLSGTAPAVSG